MNFKKIRMIFFSVIFVVQNNFIFASQNVVATQSNPNSAASQAPSNLLSAKNKKNPNDIIYVRDFGNVRVFTKGQQQIVINKTDPKNANSIQNVIYTNDKLQYTLRRSGNVAIIDLNVSAQTKHHHLVYKFEQNKKTKVAYYTVQRTKYFKETPDFAPSATLAPAKAGSENKSAASSTKSCTMAPKWIPTDLKKIADAVSESKSLDTITANKLIDKESCKDLIDDDKEGLITSLDQLFQQNGNKIVGCLQTTKAIETLEKDKALQLQTNLFISRITGFLDADKSNVINEKINFTDKDKNIKSNFKIKCGPDSELNNRMACFKDDGVNPAIFIDVKKIARKTPGALTTPIDESQLKRTLLHEFYHTGSQQISSENDKNCLDELIANNLTKLCGADKDVQNTEAKAMKCEVAKPEAVMDGKPCADQNDCTKTPPGLQTAVAQATVQADLRITQQQIQTADSPLAPNKLELISSEPVVQPSRNIAASSAAQAPSSATDGERRMVTNPSVETASDNMFKYFGNTSMAKTIGVVAAAAVITPAVAAATSVNSPTTSQNTNFVNYPLSEVKADQFSNSISTASNSQLSQSKIGNNPMVQSSSEVSTASSANTIASKSANIATTKIDKVEAAAAISNDAAQLPQASLSASKATTDVQGVRSIASVSTKVTDRSTLPEVIAKPMSQWAQAIQATKEVGGTNYSEYKNFYMKQSEKFSSELKSRKIYIQSAEKDKNGKLKTYGDSEKAEYIFIDNGQRLIRQK